METIQSIHHFNANELFHGGRYKLIKLVGVGGFAEVWEVLDMEFKTTRALKIFGKIDDVSLDKLAMEYANVAHLNHPNILRADFFDRWMNYPYLTMRYCSGGNLLDRVGSLTEHDLLVIVRDISCALAYLEEMDIVHQDIKPANILTDIVNGTESYVLCDFGISSKSRHSLRHSIKGAEPQYLTTFYAPPEKFSKNKKERQPTFAGDIFSFGVSMLELSGALTGIDHSIGNEMQNSMRKGADPWEWARGHIRKIPSFPMQRMVESMLQFNPEDRRDAAYYYSWACNLLGQEEVASAIIVESADAKFRRVPLTREELEEVLADDMFDDEPTEGSMETMSLGFDDEPPVAEVKPGVKVVQVSDGDGGIFIEPEESGANIGVSHIPESKVSVVPYGNPPKKRQSTWLIAVFMALLAVGVGVATYTYISHEKQRQAEVRTSGEIEDRLSEMYQLTSEVKQLSRQLKYGFSTQMSGDQYQMQQKAEEVKRIGNQLLSGYDMPLRYQNQCRKYMDEVDEAMLASDPSAGD